MLLRAIFLFTLFAVQAFATRAVTASSQITDEWNWTQVKITLQNTGTEVLTGLTVEYLFTVDEGKAPAFQLHVNDGVQLSMVQVSGNNWKILAQYSAIALEPGQILNNGNSLYFGIHNTDWTQWNFSDDQSFLNSGTAFLPNDKIWVTDSQGNLLWGNSGNSSVQLLSSANTSSSAVFSSAALSSMGGISSSANSGECATVEYFYQGGMGSLDSRTFSPFDWAESALEDPTNWAQVQGMAGLNMPVMRTSGSKPFVDTWVSAYRLPGERDFENAFFAMSLVSLNASQNSVGHRRWEFSLMDNQGLVSGTVGYDLPETGTQLVRIHASQFSIPSGFNMNRIVAVNFILPNVPAQQYAHNFFDNIRLECGDGPGYSSNATSSSSVVVASSSATTPAGVLTVSVNGLGSVTPGGQISALAGSQISLLVTPWAGQELQSVYFDNQQSQVSSDGYWRWTTDGGNHTLHVNFGSDPGNMRALRVYHGSHGKTSISGVYLVPNGSQYTVHFYPDRGYKVGPVVLDEIVQNDLKSSITVGPINNTTELVVEFEALEPMALTRIVHGLGSISDPGAVYIGETATLDISPAEGYWLKQLVVDGAPVPPSPAIDVAITGGHLVEAWFEPMSSLGCPVTVKSGHQMPDSYARPELQFVNQGSAFTASGWAWDYFVKLAPGDVLDMAPWDMSGDSWSVTKVARDLWRVRGVWSGTFGQDQTKIARFGLRFSDHIQWSKESELSAATGYPSTLTVNQSIPVYDENGILRCGQMPQANLPVSPVLLEVTYMDDGCDAKYLKPRIVLKNIGTQSISDFYYLYIFRADGGHIPQLDGDWYTPNNQTSLWSLGDGFYAIRYDFTGITLHPGEAIPNYGGTVLGVHYSDWAPMDRSDDYSWSSSSCPSSLTTTTTIPVYDKDGNLIYPPGGIDPLPTLPESQINILRHPSDLTVVEGEKASFDISFSYDGNVRIQWIRDGVRIPGANSLIYSISRATFSDDAALFWVELTLEDGTILLSNKAKLTVVAPSLLPVFEIQPKDMPLRVPGTVHFTSRAIDPAGGVVSYQWYINGNPVSGGASASLDLQISNMDLKNALVKVKATGKNGFTWSKTVGLKLLPEVPSSGQVTVAGKLVSSVQADGVKEEEVSVTVRLFTQKFGGRPIYEEHFWTREGMGVPVKVGAFSVRLGAGNTTLGGDPNGSAKQAFVSHKTVYAEVLVGPPSRQEIAGERFVVTAVPFAKNSP